MCLMTIVLLCSGVIQSKSCCECTAEVCDEVGCVVSVHIDKLVWLGVEMLGTLFFVVVWLDEESKQYSFLRAKTAWTTCFNISVYSDKAFYMAFSISFALGIVVKQRLN